jgi:peptidoglycan/xylan/chitin deacetylase (PgdA/CDA1 family)
MRIVIAAGFYYSGLVSLARWYTRLLGRRVIILNYHRATGGDLRRHFLYLRRHYRILPLQEALEALYAAPPATCTPRDRRTTLALTFDDGYRDNFARAYSLACELEIPITIFLPAGYIERGNRFHWLEGDHLAHHATVSQATIAGHTYCLADAQQRQAMAQAIRIHARNAQSVAEREAFLACARRTLGASSDARSEERLTSPLTWAEALTMQASGWVTYGAHTMNHPILSRLSDPSEVEYEVHASRTVLEQRSGHRVDAFAYPFGQMGDIGAYGVRAVQDAGYRWALTTVPGSNTPMTDPHLLRRVPTDVSEHWWVLAAQAAGIWWGVFRILSTLLSLYRGSRRPG